MAKHRAFAPCSRAPTYPPFVRIFSHPRRENGWTPWSGLPRSHTAWRTWWARFSVMPRASLLQSGTARVWDSARKIIVSFYLSAFWMIGVPPFFSLPILKRLRFGDVMWALLTFLDSPKISDDQGSYKTLDFTSIRHYFIGARSTI